jgi:hypothetical protein
MLGIQKQELPMAAMFFPQSEQIDILFYRIFHTSFMQSLIINNMVVSEKIKM